MKKGIVMEQHRGFTIVMTDDGLFEKAYPIENALIGYEVEYEPIVQKQWLAILKEKFFTVRVVALACVFLIALLPLYMWTNNNSTYAYVDIDINPSIEVEINEDLEVISILPFNDDAVLLIEKLGDVKGKDIELVVDKIIAASEENGFVNADKNVLIGVHYVEEDADNTVLNAIDKHFTTNDSDWDVITVEIPEEIRETAEENNISMNKVLANTVKENSLGNVKSITEEDTRVLQSFFNQHPKTKLEITTEDTAKESEINPSTDENGKVEAIKPNEQSLHPSELKGKNGEVNSAKQGKTDQRAKQHEEKKTEKPNGNNGNNNNNSINKEKKQDKNKQDKDNQKKWHQEKPKKGFNEPVSKPADTKKSQSNDFHNGKSNEPQKSKPQQPEKGQHKNHGNGQKGNGKDHD